MTFISMRTVPASLCREQSEGDDQRAERVCEMDVIRRGFEARQEAGKAGSRREPVDQRNADEYDADNAENPWHWPSHCAGLAEASASGNLFLWLSSVLRFSRSRLRPAQAPGG